MNAGERYVVQDKDIDDVLIVLSTIKLAYENSSNTLNALQKYTLHPECVHDLIGKIRAMKTGIGSSDPNVAGPELPCCLCNETPSAVECWAESHLMCAICIDDAVVHAPVSTTDDLHLPCLIEGCSSQPFTFKDLYKHIHVNVWSSHLNKKVEQGLNEVKKLQQDTQQALDEVHDRYKKLVSVVDNHLGGLALQNAIAEHFLEAVPNCRCGHFN